MSSIHYKRKNGDLKKLFECQNIVTEIDDDDLDTVYICIRGPKDTPYEDGYYWLRMVITKEYPFKSPSVIFLTPIFHPNIEYESGSICLDAINEQWTPVFNFERIFQIMIPHLLTYPNPDDPFHIYASEILIKDLEKYNSLAKNINDRYAKEYIEKPKNLILRDIFF